MPQILVHEHLLEQPDGTRTHFTTEHAYVKGTVRLWLNGQLKYEPNVDGFVELGNRKLHLPEAPRHDDDIIVQYRSAW